MKDAKTMFNWNEKKIYWNIICSETNDMNYKICSKIKQHIKGKNIAEFGCGTGYFALEMSKYANLVIATDINEDVLKVLDYNIKKQSINNIIPIKTDVYKDIFYNIDYIVAKFFSKPTRDLKSMLCLVNNAVILIVNTTSYSGMNTDEISKLNKENADTVCQYLDRENIYYEKIDMVCENGQYLKDESEVIDFLQSYTKDDEYQIQEIIKKSKLKKEYIYKEDRFNFFVSVDKKISILIIPKSNLQ